jgi:hypothetical protein
VPDGRAFPVPVAGDVAGCWWRNRAAVPVVVRKMDLEMNPTEKPISTITGTFVPFL